MKFTLHRNHTVVGLNGRAVRFEKGVPTYVQPDMYTEVMALGAVPEDELTEDEKPKQAPVVDAGARKQAIFDAFEKIIVKGDRDEFTGNGSPHNKAVSTLTGFAVDAKERDKYWLEFRQLNKEG